MPAKLKTGIAFAALFFCVFVSANDVTGSRSLPRDLLSQFLIISMIAGVAFVNVVVGIKELLSADNDSET